MIRQSPSADALCVLGTGDVCVNRDNPESIFSLVSPTINQADLAVCQVETNLSERGCAQVQHRVPMRTHPKNATALSSAGFDVVSLAGNHTLDFGVDAFRDTVKVLKDNGMAVIGAGEDIDEARKPAIIERKETRLAFLGYNSILPPGYAADIGKPGCAPMRIRTLYEPIEPEQPGTPCRTLTIPYPEDVDAMKEDIKKAKALADVVIIMMHWGLHHVPITLAMYQREVGHAAIDAGADLIIGHHPHILKGIEAYRGKVIFYSLGNFAFDISPSTLDTPIRRRIVKEIKDYTPVIDPDYPTYPFRPEARRTLLAKCIVSNKRIQKVTYLPAMIRKTGQPDITRAGSKETQEVFDFINESSRDLGTKFSFEGDEVLIHV